MCLIKHSVVICQVHTLEFFGCACQLPCGRSPLRAKPDAAFAVHNCCGLLLGPMLAQSATIPPSTLSLGHLLRFCGAQFLSWQAASPGQPPDYLVVFSMLWSISPSFSVASLSVTFQFLAIYSFSSTSYFLVSGFQISERMNFAANHHYTISPQPSVFEKCLPRSFAHLLTRRLDPLVFSLFLHLSWILIFPQMNT